MKYFTFLAVMVSVAFISCSKDSNNINDPFYSVDSVTVAINNCLTKQYKGDTTIIYCLDSVVESRCPIGTMCIWQGFATAKLNIGINNLNHLVNLSTITHIATTPNDTTISGFNFRLVDVTPYPAIGNNNYNSYKAIIKVTRQ